MSTEPDVTTSDLHVPDKARAEIAWQRGYNLPDLEPGAVDLLNIRVQQIAAPVVAAELRRMAALLDETDDARKLLRRADELDRSQGGDER